MFSNYINKIYTAVSGVQFDTLVWIVFGSFAGIFALAFLMCFISPKIRAASKRPFLCLANAYAAVTLAAFLSREQLPQSMLAAVLFWCAGYIAYGVLCFITKPLPEPSPSGRIISSLPVAVSRPEVKYDVPAAKSSVRLEHAISVTDKLLLKNPGKSDRQELEKLKSTLLVLQTKGELSPAEGDILNENFNALLKLMAKYNV